MKEGIFRAFNSKREKRESEEHIVHKISAKDTFHGKRIKDMDSGERRKVENILFLENAQRGKKQHFEYE